MRSYITIGPIEVNFRGSGAKKFVSKEAATEFWEDLDADYPWLADLRGVYVFGIRAGQGSTPIYVGKATKTFRQEALTAAKRDHYNDALHRRQTGTPVLFFIRPVSGRGSAKDIGEIEKQFIQLAKRANPNLQNSHHTSKPNWEVDILGGKGRPAQDVGALRRMLNLAR